MSLVPSREWAVAGLKQNGQHTDDVKPSLLGLSLRVCNPAHALESVYHVLDVLEGSPAEASIAMQQITLRYLTRRWRAWCHGATLC